MLQLKKVFSRMNLNKMEESGLIKIVEGQIENCLKGLARCSEQNRLDYFQRTDELFLLWAKIEEISFVKAVESFGINYDDFNNKDYEKVSNQIITKYKKDFEETKY